MTNSFLFKDIENKTIVWLKNQNQYVVLENNAADILKQLDQKKSITDISESLVKKINIPYQETFDIVQEIETNLYIPNTQKPIVSGSDFENIAIDTEFSVTRFYKIQNLIFKVDFQSEYEDFLIHPKYAHLTIEKTTSFDFHYKVFTKNKETLLIVNDQIIGSWKREDIHYFQGKFSMMMIQNMYQKEEDKWMGVFHASAVSNDKKSVLFLGDSGNGKSTSLALLQANGFTCLADDFVPIDIEKKEVYSFPAAISIKKNSLSTLLPFYPELETTAEYHFKTLNKIVRFLKPNNTNFLNHLPCNNLVFIKYQKDSATVFNKISKINAFEQLVPDSWISPIEKNAQIFLDWFENLNCYQLTYSINNEMIEKVTKLFNDEL